MTTGELIDQLKAADPSGYRNVVMKPAARLASERDILDVKKGVASEVYPVTIIVEAFGSDNVSALAGL